MRLKNGAIMPSGGITVASENPVYIQGDYNTGRVTNGSGVVTTETPANTANNGTGNNIVAGYTEQPCAVLGDAINILSNNWSDSKSTAATERVARGFTDDHQRGDRLGDRPLGHCLLGSE